VNIKTFLDQLERDDTYKSAWIADLAFPNGEIRDFLAVPGPVVGAGLPGLSWQAVFFSAGGGAVRSSPEHLSGASPDARVMSPRSF
jgi:hypothetical protein